MRQAPVWLFFTGHADLDRGDVLFCDEGGPTGKKYAAEIDKASA